MTWERFVEAYRIPKRFADVDPKLVDENLKKTGQDWLANPHSLLLSGLAGRGKTYFTLSMIRVLLSHCGLGQLIFAKSKSIDDEIVSSINEYGSATYVIEKYKEINYLFIDDFGIDRATERAERDYYEIFDHRWADMKVTVLSTNLDAEQLEEIYGARIFSRLKDFKWVNFGGPDLRGRK